MRSHFPRCSFAAAVVLLCVNSVVVAVDEGQDSDGLSDIEEVRDYNTDPTHVDSS